MNPKELYTERVKVLSNEIYQLNRHNRLVVVLELLAVALAVGCVVAYTMWSHFVWLVVAALFVSAYVAIRWKDSSNSRLSEQKKSIRSIYQQEMAYLDGDFSGFPSGEQYVNPHHDSPSTSTFSGRSRCSTVSIEPSLLAAAISWPKSLPRRGCGVSTRSSGAGKLSVNCQRKSRCVLHSLPKAAAGR